MNNLETVGSKIKRNPFFVFSKPYLDFIGKGKIFGFIYYVIAILNLLIPFVVISSIIDSGILRYGGASFVFATIFSWLIIAFACWIGFQLWWDRRTNFVNTTSAEFIATLCFSDIIQTIGEWLGTMLAIIGAGIGLITFIFLRNDSSELFYSIGLGFMSYGPLVIIIGSPILGFFILIFFRFIAEQLRLLASFVNNTKDISTNVQGLLVVSKKTLINSMNAAAKK
jgi:hypothetical protein